MAGVRVEVMENGPYIVIGDVELTGPDGERIPTKKKVIALCRCGGSRTKPFCDGTHSEIGFQGAMNAVEEADAEDSPDTQPGA